MIESVNELGIKQLGFESIHLPYAFWQSFSEALGEKGVEEVVKFKLSSEETEKLKKSAAAVKELVDIVKV